jgi:hypothetical protein
VLLPDQTTLADSGVIVQPDATIATGECHVLVEAKRIRSSAFQPRQLAREYLAVRQDARQKHAILLLILGTSPPVKVAGRGSSTIEDAVRTDLPGELPESVGTSEIEALMHDLGQIVAWTTWSDIDRVVREQLAAYDGDDELSRVVRRLAQAVTHAIAWHA